jgi:hypothetical protein
MKKIYILLFVLSLPSIASAQIWVTAGYGFSWLNTDGANFIIDRYNGTRNYLSKELDRPGAFTGFGINGGLNFVSIQMDVRYNFRSTQLTSEGVVNGTNFKREIDMSFDSFGFGIGYGAFEDIIGYGIGATIEIIRPEISTKITGSSETEVDVTSFSTAVSPHVILMIKLGKDIPIGFSVRPYYTIGLDEIDYSDLNKTINPATYENDQAENQISTLKGFGIELQFGLMTSLGF